MSMEIDIFENTLIACVSGELDDHVARTSREKLDRALLKAGVKNIIFDFSELTMMDSAGIGLVIGRYKRISERGGAAVIVLGGTPARKTLKMSGLLKLFESFESLDAAVMKLCKKTYSRI